MRPANDSLRFLLELGLLTAFGYWGWTEGEVEGALFGGGAAALVRAGEPVWAAIFGGPAALQFALTFPLGQRRA